MAAHQRTAATGLPLKAPPAEQNALEFEAPDVRVRSTIRVSSGKEARVARERHPWYTIGSGFTYCGRCPNVGCAASLQWVAKHAGYRTFRPSEDLDFGYVTCPSCSGKFVPQIYMFHKCTVHMSYRLVGCKPDTIQFTTHSDHEAEQFGGNIERLLAKYTSLVITVDHVDERLKNHKVLLQVQQDNPIRMDPAGIRYCQDSCSCVFQCLHFTLDDTRNGLISGRYAVDDIPPISVFVWKERYFTVNNRRLWCFKNAEVDSIPVKIITLEEVTRRKLTTKDDGCSIRVRWKKN